MFNPNTLLDQIGRGNLLAISGGRVVTYTNGIKLPVSNGYHVTVDYMPNDTYTVRRLFIRGAKVFTKAEWTDVYAEQIGAIAYEASCFNN